MIKLIATDMDHTLLNDDSELPSDFGDVVTLLNEKGIHFILASGRTLFSIKKKAANHLDNLNFISDNGAIVEYEKEIQYINNLDDISIHEILNICRNCTEASIVASSIDKAYIEVYSDEHKQKLHEYYNDFDVVDDISKVDDKIVKITMLSLDSTFDNFDLIPRSLHENFACVLAGKWWIDIMNEGVSKGKALASLIESLDIKPSEVAAFGDFHNDITMLELAGHSFAMGNAHDDVKAIASEVIGTNNEQAVTQKIKELVKK